MKTANEILTEIDVALCLSTFQMRKLELLRLFQEQQLDAKRAGMTEAANVVGYWKAGHESRLRIWPDNECIKCKVKDCEELKQHILSARDNLKEI